MEVPNWFKRGAFAPDRSPMVILNWSRFSSFIAARTAAGRKDCVYVQADAQGCPVRVGMARSGLASRYNGGTGHALDAAMHQSGNLVFVALAPAELCLAIEETLIWAWRAALTYNKNGKLSPPRRPVEIEHRGEVPWVPGVSTGTESPPMADDRVANGISARRGALPEDEMSSHVAPGGRKRNLDDTDLDALVRRLRDEGFTSVNQICRQIRGTPQGTNTNRLKASFARVIAEAVAGSASHGPGPA